MENRRNPTFQYFGGSAVESAEWLIPEAAGRSIPQEKTWSVRIDLTSLGGLVMAVVMTCMMVVGGVRYYEARREAAAAQAQVLELQQEQANLRTAYEAGFDPEEIRQKAEELGMIPMEQVRTVQIHVPAPPEELTFGSWLREFFTDLLA